MCEKEWFLDVFVVYRNDSIPTIKISNVYWNTLKTILPLLSVLQNIPLSVERGIVLVHTNCAHDDVIKWKHFPRNWPFVRVPGEFPTKRPVTWSFEIFFELRPNKRLSKQWPGWWSEMQSSPLWRHRNVFTLQVPAPNDPKVITVLAAPNGVKPSAVTVLHQNVIGCCWYFKAMTK